LSAIYADLHAHTTASDGEFSPEQLAEAAAAAGVKVLAVTDHDTTAGLVRAEARGKELGVEIIPGCELTAYLRGVELHILAYFFNPADGTPLAKLLEEVRQKRRERALEMAARLRAQGIEVSDQDVLDAAQGADSIGKPHVGAAIVKRGHAGSVKGAMNKFLRNGMPACVPKLLLAPEQVFAAVRGAGGVTVLAHPGCAPHDELIAPLFRAGLDGVEAFHQSHSDVNRRYYAGLARRYEKAVGGGSDFHGPRVKPGVTVGCSGVSEAQFEDLHRRSASKR